ncbi:MAG TPA: Crp/Fnr family transcriptional regulator [Rhodospirillaceae bacterium]|nr:Crp/Fnr family transcriptional regulator [Rhodospirillaceae bacterium]
MSFSDFRQDRHLFKRQTLGKSTLFGTLPPDDLEHLASISKLFAVQKQTLLFSKGDVGERLYLVVKGLIRITTISVDGRESILNLVGPGKIFGEIAVLDGGLRTADAIAVEDSELLSIERKDLMLFLHQSPHCCIRMLAACASRMRWISSLLEDTHFLDLPARLAKRLLLLARSFGQPVANGIRIDIRLSQQDLANHLNVSRESINKLINNWEQQGLVQTGRGKIFIVDRERLEQCIIDEH